MQREATQKLIEYLSSHYYLNLATIGPDNSPVAHTVGYVSEGATVYFATDKKSRKARNIAARPAVAYTVDEDYRDLNLIRGVQMQGRAELVRDPSTIEKILGIMMRKYPQMKDMPENPDYVLFRIVPGEAYFIDNTAGFGYRDHLVF